MLTNKTIQLIRLQQHLLLNEIIYHDTYIKFTITITLCREYEKEDKGISWDDLKFSFCLSTQRLVFNSCVPLVCLSFSKSHIQRFLIINIV